MQFLNPWKSYRQIATQTASPGQLVLMLYEGAIRFLDKARSGFALEDPADSNETISNNILRAQEIIHELNLSLDLSTGQLASTLHQLYDYMDRRLMEANVQKNSANIEEVIRHLAVLRDAWAQILPNHSPPTDRVVERPEFGCLEQLAAA
jgi:flagellar secretion chaperone FliS